MNAIPRRIRLDLMTPEELALYNMVGEIEKLGAHPLLTDAVVLLGDARRKLADWIDLSDTTITAVNMSYSVFQDEEVEASGLTISWDSKKLGFGELSIMVSANGEVEIDAENMDKAFYMDLMSRLYDLAAQKG